MLRNADDRQRLLERQDELDNDDDEQLLGTQSHFVPAVSSAIVDDDDDARCLLERDQDEVVLLTTAPTSGAALTYCVFYLLGIGTMTPWNFFVTAEDVSGSRSRHISLDQPFQPQPDIFTCPKCITFALSPSTAYLFPRYTLLFL